MSCIARKLAELQKRGEAALIPFITAGDPNLAITLKILRALEKGARTALSWASLSPIPLRTGRPFSDRQSVP